MIDREKCESCLSCYLACMDSHRTDGGSGTETLDFSDKNSAARNRIAVDGTDCTSKRFPMFCRHCSEPKCEASCMSGALCRDEETGHVKYDEKRCGACFMCVMNCPFGIPKPDASRTKIIKCDFCNDREEGPACVAACPTKAIFVEEVSA